MLHSFKKISLYVGMFAGFVLTMQAFQGTFKTIWFGKTIRISTSSQKFLKQIVPLQKKLFSCLVEHKCMTQSMQKQINVVLHLSNCWSVASCMQGTDVENFGDAFVALRQEHYKSNISRDDHDMIFNRCFIQQMIDLLLQELQKVYIGTAVSDLKLIKQFLEQLRQQTQFDVSYQMSLVRIQGILFDIIHHFDGLSVTEYDFMVLSQCALFVQLIKISLS